MASKENQEALDYIYKNSNGNSEILEKLLTLQQAIDDLEIKNVALEKACDMVSFYEGMDYKYFVEKYVKEAKKDIKELEELENGK